MALIFTDSNGEHGCWKIRSPRKRQNSLNFLQCVKEIIWLNTFAASFSFVDRFAILNTKLEINSVPVQTNVVSACSIIMTIPDELFENASSSPLLEERNMVDVMTVLSSVIASVGVIANFTVVFVFGSNAKLRTKIPNIYIINQVRIIYIYIIRFP